MNLLIRTPKNVLLVAIFFSALSWSCGNEESSSEQQKDILPDSVNTDGMANVDPRFLIQSQGLSFVNLGQPLNELDTIVPDLGILQDTLVYDQDYVLATRTLTLDDGVVVVEGEYIDENKVNNGIIASSSVNRVRIESPRFQTRNGLSVGMSVRDLKQMFPEEEFYINPIIGYDALDISGVFNTHIHYLVSDPGNELARSKQEGMSLDDLPAEAPFFAIVLMR